MALAFSVFTGLVDFDMKLPAVSFLHVFSCEHMFVSCAKKTLFTHTCNVKSKQLSSLLDCKVDIKMGITLTHGNPA